MEEIADVIETLDNLVVALTLDVPADTHIKALRKIIPEQRDRLKAAYLALGGEDFWGE